MRLRDLFAKPGKELKNLRSVATTNSDGVTTVDLKKLFSNEDFLAKSKKLEEFAREILPLGGIPPRG